MKKMNPVKKSVIHNQRNKAKETPVSPLEPKGTSQRVMNIRVIIDTPELTRINQDI
jgi:hypothetical protein